jgi:hypothetical protein
MSVFQWNRSLCRLDPSPCQRARLADPFQLTKVNDVAPENLDTGALPETDLP